MLMASKLDKQIFTNEFESHWALHSYGLVPHLSKKLYKLQFFLLILNVSGTHVPSEWKIDQTTTALQGWVYYSAPKAAQKENTNGAKQFSFIKRAWVSVYAFFHGLNFPYAELWLGGKSAKFLLFPVANT